jgi:hypothetical protein
MCRCETLIEKEVEIKCKKTKPTNQIHTHQWTGSIWRLSCIYYVSGHYPLFCLYLKQHPVYISKHILETGFCLRLQAKLTQLGPIDRAGPYVQKHNICTNERIMSRNQKYNICTNVPLSQTFRSYYEDFHVVKIYLPTASAICGTSEP